MRDLVAWLTSLPLSLAIRKTSWLIPLMQIIHILAIGMVMSSVIMIDLRVWGYARSLNLAQSARRFAPWVWTSMVVLTATGIVLIIAAPRRTLLDLVFQVKMLLTAVAIALTIALLVAIRRNDADAPVAGKVTAIFAAAVLVLWIVVTLAGRGRWIGNFLR